MSTKLSWSKCIGAIDHARWMGAATAILKMLIVGMIITKEWKFQGLME